MKALWFANRYGAGILSSVYWQQFIFAGAVEGARKSEKTKAITTK